MEAGAALNAPRVQGLETKLRARTHTRPKEKRESDPAAAVTQLLTTCGPPEARQAPGRRQRRRAIAGDRAEMDGRQVAVRTAIGAGHYSDPFGQPEVLQVQSRSGQVRHTVELAAARNPVVATASFLRLAEDAATDRLVLATEAKDRANVAARGRARSPIERER